MRRVVAAVRPHGQPRPAPFLDGHPACRGSTTASRSLSASRCGVGNRILASPEGAETTRPSILVRTSYRVSPPQSCACDLRHRALLSVVVPCEAWTKSLARSSHRHLDGSGGHGPCLASTERSRSVRRASTRKSRRAPGEVGSYSKGERSPPYSR